MQIHITIINPNGTPNLAPSTRSRLHLGGSMAAAINTDKNV